MKTPGWLILSLFYLYLAAVYAFVVGPIAVTPDALEYRVALGLLWPVFFVVGIFELISEPVPALNSEGIGLFAHGFLILLVFTVPYFTVLSFFVENKNGIPYAYRWLQFFITDSGARYVDGEFDPEGFKRATEGARRDRYQSKMETQELKEAAARARAEAEKARVHHTERMKAETERVKAAEEAAKAAEEKYRAKARERASRRHSK